VGYRVTAEVFEHSRQKGGKLLILLAIAEKASNDDSVAFGIDQGWPREERSARKKRETIAGKARLNPATVSRSIQELIRDDELEVRWVRQGQARWAVYRIVIGEYRQREVDVEFLERHGQLLDRPFSTPAELLLPWSKRPGNRAVEPQEVPDVLSGTSEGDHLAKDQVAPDEMSGGHLTSAHGDTSYPRARGSRTTVQQQVHEDLRPSPEDREDPAAAEAPPTRTEVSEIVGRLRGADAGSERTVWMLACQLPREAFVEIVSTVRDRARTGRIANPCGLLVSLLKVDLAERAANAAVAFAEAIDENTTRYVPAPWVSDELVRWAPGLYVRQLAEHVDDADLRARLEPHHPGEIPELLELAAAVRDGEIPAAAAETPEQARTRWVDDRASDPDFPIEEIELVVQGWVEVDDVERAEHLDRAARVRAELERQLSEEHAA
jgi:hypothetical protein